MRRYTVVLERDPETGSFGVTVPALPGCSSVGMTLDEALTNAKEAIGLFIEDLEASGETVPEEPEGTLVIVASVAA
jgi:antitoxin HicB